MKCLLSVALPALVVGCLLAGAACQSSTVRGTGGRSVTATTPTSMMIHRGDSAPLEIGIDRAQFTGAVTVSIFQLPKGVTADKASISAETTSATFILTATPSADLVTNQAVGVTVEALDGRKATQFINITVKE